MTSRTNNAYCAYYVQINFRSDPNDPLLSNFGGSMQFEIWYIRDFPWFRLFVLKLRKILAAFILKNHNNMFVI